MRGGTAPDLLIDGVEVGEIAHGGAGALLAGGGFLLLGRKVAPAEPRLLFLDRPRSRSWLPPPCGRLWVPSGSAAASARRSGVSRAVLSFFRGQWLWAEPLSW